MATGPDQEDPAGGARELPVDITTSPPAPTPFALRLVKGPGAPRALVVFGAREGLELRIG